MRGIVAAMNHRHVADMLGSRAADRTEEDLARLGRVIGRCWRTLLEEAFPDRALVFELGEEIWFWEHHDTDRPLTLTDGLRR